VPTGGAMGNAAVEARGSDGFNQADGRSGLHASPHEPPLHYAEIPGPRKLHTSQADLIGT
jgi:hypothetical protein